MHIEKTKELTKADVMVAVMSSCFVQRGEPSIISKENRVKLALESGVDVIVELPFLYSVESSDYFCRYSIEILNNLKVKDICFGSETGETKEFLNKYNNTKIVQPHLDFLVSDLMDEGMSYPCAMSKALEIMDSFRAETPNDILGLGYYKEIKSNNYPIEIFTYKRENNYNN
jgi:predicted nucleotidyltransferase